MPNAIGTNVIGPSFVDELAAANLLGLPFAYDANGNFSFSPSMTANQTQAVMNVYAAHNPTKQPIAAIYAGKLAGGVAVTSTGTPALNGTYGCAPQDIVNLTALQTAINTSPSLFPGRYHLQNMAKVTLTAAQFAAIAEQILGFVTACDIALEDAANGLTPTWPPSSVTIA